MTRNNADFQQPIIVYRGLAGVHPNDVNYDNLGRHWSSSREFPEVIADPTKSHLIHLVPEEKRRGVILQGTVSPEHVVQPGTDEWRDLYEKHSMMPPNSEDGKFEREVTIRTGAPVNVTRVTEFEMGGNKDLPISATNARA